ncbi:MAG: hypothetical protein IJU74_05580, partial [Bacteroidales bacterium]|nr:hypothetical protein [Bacteroidales bacterium]
MASGMEGPPKNRRTFRENGLQRGRSPEKSQDLPGKWPLAWKVPRKKRRQLEDFLPTFSIFLTTNPGFLTTFDIGIRVGITGMPDTLYKSFNLLNILQKVRDVRFFLNSHPILADIGKNYYICIGIEALIADRLWNSLPSVNMQNC